MRRNKWVDETNLKNYFGLANKETCIKYYYF